MSETHKNSLLNSSQVVITDYEIVRQTDKAILIRQGDNDYWFPKSKSWEMSIGLVVLRNHVRTKPGLVYQEEKPVKLYVWESRTTPDAKTEEAARTSIQSSEGRGLLGIREDVLWDMSIREYHGEDGPY